MKKLIRFTMMLLMITGVFIFAQGAKVEALTNLHGDYNVYSYTSSDTTHTLPNLYNEIDNMVIYVNGYLVWDGDYLEIEKSTTRGLYFTGISIEQLYIMYDGDDVVYFTFDTNEIVSESSFSDIVIIVYNDLNSFNSWGFSDPEYENQMDSNNINLNNISIYMSGVLAYNSPTNYNSFTFNDPTWMLSNPNMKIGIIYDGYDAFVWESTGYVDNTFGYHVVIIESITNIPSVNVNVYDEFTVYSYDNTNYQYQAITPRSTDLNNYIVFINGQLVFKFGTQFGSEYTISNNGGGSYLMIETIDDVDSWALTNNISNNLEINVLIVIADHQRINTWGFPNGANYENQVDIFHLMNDTQSGFYGYANGTRAISNGIPVIPFNYVKTPIPDTTFVKLRNTGDVFGVSLTSGTAYNSYGYDMVFFQVYENEYTITFDTAGGTAISQVTATEGALLGEVIWDPGIVTTKDGYTFDDWYKNASYTIPVTEIDTVTTDLTVYANWIQDIINYTITFNTVGGSYIAPEEIQENSTLSQPTDPYKDGYIFGGWFTDAFFLNTYDFNDPVTSNMTLYAQWTQLDADTSSDWNDWIANNILVVILVIVVIVIIFKR